MTNTIGGLDLSAIYAAIPPEQADMLREAAASLTGTLKEDITTERAVELLGTENPNPALRATMDLMAEKFTEQLFGNMTEAEEAQLRQELRAAQVSGDLQAAALELMAHIAQAAQNAQEAPQRPLQLRVHTEHDPRLDPKSPEFDLAAFRQAVESSIEKLKEGAARVSDLILKLKDMESGAGSTFTAAIRLALSGVLDFLASDAFRAYRERAVEVTAFIHRNAAELAQLADMTPEEVKDLAPFLEIELEDMQDAQDGAALDDLLTQAINGAGGPVALIKQAIAQAKEQQANEGEAPDVMATVEAMAELPRIMMNPTDLLSYPLDKPNHVIWDLLAATEIPGQIGMGSIDLNIRTSPRGVSPASVVYCSLSFDAIEDVKISKQLTPFDKRVYIAAAALYNGGNSIISASQIHRMMGNSTSANAVETKKINDSLTKMGAARVYLDSTKEGSRHPRFKYDAPLLPFERISAYINNTLTESAIKLFREPPLMTFARERGQITPITVQLLDVPHVSKSEANLRLEDYLIDRIGHMKRAGSNAPRKILYTTVFDRCGITEKKQRQRAPAKIQKCLNHYKACGWIADYTAGNDGITIRTPEDAEREAKGAVSR